MRALIAGAALALAVLAPVAAPPPAHAAPLPDAWCGTDTTATDRPDAVAGNQLHVVYARPRNEPDRFADMANAIAAMRRRKPAMQKVVAKLNEGVSGMGNANVSLAGLPAPGSPGEHAAIVAALNAMAFESAKMTYDRYVEKLAAHGGIVEELISGREFRSPSAQLRVTPLGEVAEQELDAARAVATSSGLRIARDTLPSLAARATFDRSPE